MKTRPDISPHASRLTHHVIEVSAALIFRDGQLLITQRHAKSHLGGLWEFPGGKREPGESFEECLHRELREELGIEVQIDFLIQEIIHCYPERPVRLRFFRCRWLRHEPKPILCESLAWITSGQLSRSEEHTSELQSPMYL